MAKPKKTVEVTKLVTTKEVLAATRWGVVTAFQRFLSTVVAVQNDWFIEKGGCDRCGGTGQIRVHYTLDYVMGEIETCPDCRSTGEAHGRVSGFERLYGASSGIMHRIHAWLEFMKSELLDEYNEFQEALGRIGEMEHAERDFQNLKVGKRVRVVKGRKVPVGTEGHVIWIQPPEFAGQIGRRIGVKDDAGETHWTSMDNVLVVASTKSQEAKFEADREAYRTRRAAERSQ